MISDMTNNLTGAYALLWMLLPLLLSGGLVALVIWALIRVFRGSGGWTDPAEEDLRGRFARGEIGADEYERSLKALRIGRNTVGAGGTDGAGAKPKVLVAGLAAAALLAVAAGVPFAYAQMGSTTGGNGMGSMMSMMGGNDMSSMMSNGQGMSGGQMMGSFDENQPFDLQFIDQMTMHHEGAIMSSENMIGDSERPELRQLAENIQRSQSEQIEQMQAWRKQWYGNAGQTFGPPVGTMDQMMGGVMQRMMGGSMQEVMGGDATDAMFLRMMIPHHQIAIDMSERALEEAEHPELKELAQKIIDEQSAEIELMQGYLDEIETTSGNR